MKRLIYILLLLLSSNSFSQSEKSKLNRAYMQLEYGFTRQVGAGLTIHSFEHLSTSFSISSKRYQHEESFVTAKNSKVNEVHRLYDVQEKYNLLIGGTTKTLDLMDVSLMAGPSYVEHKIYSNVEVKELYSELTGTTTEYFEYDLNEQATWGIAVRTDFAFSISNYFGVNIAAEASFNELRHVYNVLVGLNFGLTRDLNKLRSER